MSDVFKITAEHIRCLLRRRYCDEMQWCLSFEVANATGRLANRYADAIAVNLWPSNGYAIHGFEIKVSRSDLLKELGDPHKWEGVGKHCDYWWLVAPKEIVHLHELPVGWGVMIATEKRLRVLRAPSAQGDIREPAAMDRGFVAALLKRKDKNDPSFQEKLESIGKQYETQLERELSAERQLWEKKLTNLESVRKFKDEFENAFGRVFRWEHGKEEADAVKAAYLFIMRMRDLRGNYYLGDRIRNITKEIDRHVHELEEVIGQIPPGHTSTDRAV